VQPSVVLITGQLITNEVWGPQIAALKHKVDFHYAEQSVDDSIPGMALRLLAGAPDRFHLVGHAMGGFVALEVMRHAPQRVLSLALLSTLAPNDGPAQTERRQGYIKLVKDGRFAQVIEDRIPLLVHPARREDQPILTAIRRMARDTGEEIFLRQQRAIMTRSDSRPILAGITCPTLVVWGRHDGLCSLEHQQQLHYAIAGSRLEVIEHCGHLVTLEMPATVSSILERWLKS